MHVEVIVKSGLYEIIHEASDGRTLLAASCAVRILGLGGPHVSRTELGLRLVGEDRLLDLDADRSDDALTDVLRSEILLGVCLEELLEGLRNCRCLHLKYG